MHAYGLRVGLSYSFVRVSTRFLIVIGFPVPMAFGYVLRST